MNYVYKDTRPRITIEYVDGRGLGRCYSAARWRVTSRYRLEDETLGQMNRIGILGFGQEFIILSNPDAPAGHDTVPCVGEDEQGKEYPDPVNPYSGKPYGPTQMAYFVALVESRVDSSD